MAMKPLPAALEDAFERFWRAFPRRRPNPKVEARKAFALQVQKGADPEDLVRAAAGYAEECRREKVDPPFIVHARTFLRQERWQDYLGEAEALPAAAAPRHPELKKRLVPPLSEADFAVWIEPLSFEPQYARVVVWCPSRFHLERVRVNYEDLLCKALRAPAVAFQVGSPE